MGTILGVISFVSTMICIYTAYIKAGATEGNIGVAAFLSFVFALIGLILGAVTVRNKDYYMVFPRLSLFLNLSVLLILGFVLRLSMV